jgi:hypothetical protein
MTLYDLTIPSFQRSVRVLSRLLDKADEHFLKEGRGPRELGSLCLAPDMKPFSFQIEAVINNAVGATARLRGLPVPQVEGLATLPDMRDAVAAAVIVLDAVDPRDFAGAENREIVLPSPKGARHFEAQDYVLMLALPNIHFHTAIAYALLRGEGVDLGKRDFLGELPARRPPAISAL